MSVRGVRVRLPSSPLEAHDCRMFARRIGLDGFGAPVEHECDVCGARLSFGSGSGRQR